MRKLRCTKYLNQAKTKEDLYTYVSHLFSAHRHNLPRAVCLIELSSSGSRFSDAYREIGILAKETEENYSKRR